MLHLLRALAGYSAALLLAVVFMRYLDGEIGVLMLFFLILIPILSLAVTLFFRKKLEISLETQRHIDRGTPLTVHCRVKKKTRLPMPFLSLSLKEDAHFSPDKAPEEHRFAMPFEQQAEISFSMEPVLAGHVQLELRQAELSDFLGFLKLPLRTFANTEVSILPRVPELQASGALFQSMMSTLLADEENEQEDEINSPLSLNVTAGYEHRPYEPGDSLKRINWKLSAKRRSLMVRKEESASLSRAAILLDFARYSHTMESAQVLEQEQCCAEAALGMVRLCAKQGLPAVFYYQADGAWHTCLAESPEQAEQEAVTVMDTGFSRHIKERIPASLRQDGTSVLLVFTTAPDAVLCRQLRQYPAAHLLIPSDIPAPSDGSRCWTISRNYQIKPAQGSG